MGGGGSAPQRKFGQEWPSIKGFENKQFGQLRNYVRGQPLLQTAEDLALWSSDALTKPTAQAAIDWILPILQGGGRSAQTTREGQQDARAAFGARGNIGGNQAIAGEILGTQRAREQQYGWAQGMMGQAQNTVTSGLNQLLGTQQTEVSTFAAIVDPVLQYLSTLFAGNQQAQLAAQQASQGKTAGLAGGALNALGSIGGAALMASDERLKEKIRDTGISTEEGIPLKIFRYKDDPQKRDILGVVAQDVEKRRPDAVHEHPSGFKFVDFSSLNAPMLEVQVA